MAGVIDQYRAASKQIKPLTLDPGDRTKPPLPPGDSFQSNGPRPVVNGSVGLKPGDPGFVDASGAVPVPKQPTDAIVPPVVNDTNLAPQTAPTQQPVAQADTNPLSRPSGPPDMSGVTPGTPTSNPAARTPLPPGDSSGPVDNLGLANIPPGGIGSTSPTSSGNGKLAWNPTSGIVDQIRGITPKDTTATGYESGGVEAAPDATSTGYDATGYTAQQGEAKTNDLDLSGALDRVLGNDSPILQRARAGAAQSANQRGLLNSSMAVQGGEAAAIDAALPIAQGDVQNRQFNAEQQNVMTINNVQQANAALAFHAQATNEAAQFAAAAKNSASQFNSAQAQQRAIAASQLWDQAAAFSAAAKNAAASQNAQAYNEAMQKYVDAKNAAIAAQNDAENLARRDTAQLSTQKEIASMQANATVAAASAHAGATVAAARISSEAQERMNNARLDQSQQQFVANLGANAFNQFQTGLTAIELQDLEPDARQNALHNYASVWSTNTNLPFTIDMSAFPAAGG